MERLLEHFSLIAEAPNGVKRLREIILHLAVQGKLVKQDPTDEPAAELLNEIAAEKAKLIKEKKIKKNKALSSINDDEKYFDLPVGWVWCRFYDVTFSRDSERVPLSRVQREKRAGQYDYYGASGIIDSIDDFIFDEKLLLIGEDGANLINRTKPIAFIAEGQYWVNNHAHVVDTLHKEMLDFFSIYINAIDLKPYVTGTAQPKMNQAKMNSIPFALPPLAEQKRIVERVDALMTLCDCLETQQEKAKSCYAATRTAVFEALGASQNSAEFNANWKRLLENFDELLTKPEDVEVLRQTILQLAVRGKLTKQYSNDEPASVLLEVIAGEKAKLVKEKRIKKGKTLPAISDDEKPFELPEGWEWCRWADIGELARGKSKHRPRNDPSLYEGGTYPFVQTGNVARSNYEILNCNAYYNEKGLGQSRLWPAGTLCITIAANIADSAILGFDACFPDSVVGFIPYEPISAVDYFFFFMNTIKSELEVFAPSTAQKNINLTILNEIKIPLPPLHEQQRIVHKVKILLNLCDELQEYLLMQQANLEAISKVLVAFD